MLWQNASGNVAQWQMNGDHIAENLTVGSHSIDWHMVRRAEVWLISASGGRRTSRRLNC